MSGARGRAHRWLFLILGVTASWSGADVVSQSTLIRCPIDETRLYSSANQMHRLFDGLSTRIDRRPDRLPVLQECPADGFVWQDLPTERETRQLRDWVRSDAYQKELRPQPPFYRHARILERLGRPHSSLSLAFRQAAWEVEFRDRGRYRQLLVESHAHLVHHLADLEPATSGTDTLRDELVAAELERQIGWFEQARKRLVRIRDGAVHEKLKQHIARALELIAERERAPAQWCCDHIGYGSGSEIAVEEAMTSKDVTCAEYDPGSQEARARIEAIDFLKWVGGWVLNCRNLYRSSEKWYQERCPGVEIGPNVEVWTDVDEGRIATDMTRCAVIAAWGMPSRIRLPEGPGCQLWVYERKTGADQYLWLDEEGKYLRACGPSSPDGSPVPESARSSMVCGPPDVLMPDFGSIMARPAVRPTRCEELPHGPRP